MSNYSMALFLHVVGALGFFVVQDVEWIGLAQVRRPRLPEEARAILGTVKSADWLGVVSMLFTVVTGIYTVRHIRSCGGRKPSTRRVWQTPRARSWVGCVFAAAIHQMSTC